MFPSDDRRRVLLVDDCPEILNAVERILVPVCNIVGATTDPLRAVETASALRPDAIVLDLSMPGCSGLDLCRELIESLPGVRIVILTAMTDEDVEREAFRRGASAFVGKHEMSQRLPTVIRHLFDSEPSSTPT